MYEIFYIALVSIILLAVMVIGYLGYKFLPPTVRYIRQFIRWNRHK